MNLSSQKEDIKFEELYDVDDWEIETPDGWKEIFKIGKTILYEVFKLITYDGLSFSGADEHIFYDENDNEKFLKDFKKGDFITTENGISIVKSCKKLNKKENMFDVQVEDSIYYGNKFKCHNTLILSHLAKTFLMNGKNVLYITLEDGEMKIAGRIDQNNLDLDNEKILFLKKDDYLNNLKKINSKTSGKLKIVQFPSAYTNFLTINDTYDDLKIKYKFIPDVLILDYLSCLRPIGLRSFDNLYTVGKMLAEEARGFAVKENIPVISACQVNREGSRKSDIDLTDIAESYAIAHTADWSASIIQPESLDAINQYMFRLIKTRYGVLKKFDSRYCVGVEKETQRLYNLDDPKKGLSILNKKKDIDNTDKEEIIKSNKYQTGSFDKFSDIIS